jgi:hypothetical protein
VYDENGKDAFYPLPETDLILLIFQCSGNKQIFTTLRRYEVEKWNYYQQQVGKDFGVVLE